MNALNDCLSYGTLNLRRERCFRNIYPVDLTWFPDHNESERRAMLGLSTSEPNSCSLKGVLPLLPLPFPSTEVNRNSEVGEASN